MTRCLSTLAGIVAITVSLASAGTPLLAAEENSIPLVMRTPHSGFNRMAVSLTICEPGTTRCATIDNIMVDTGSTGLRLQAAALPPALRLPAFTGPSGKGMAECLRFVSSNAWGALHLADLRIGTLKAERLPVQVVEQGPSLSRPEGCEVSGGHPTSNGTLGIGTALSDCRGDCLQSATHPLYFECDGAGCAPLAGAVPAAYRLPNPVTRLPTHNNGIVIDLPAAPAGGAREVPGTLTFGVGTSANNQLGHARLLHLDAHGRFSTLYNGTTIANTYIDTGTETYVLDDPTLPRCPRISWAYCANPAQERRATLVGADGTRIDTPFRVGDYQSVLEEKLGASDSAATAPSAGHSTFVWGAPFFLGRRVTVLIEGMSPPGAPSIKGPLYAY